MAASHRRSPCARNNPRLRFFDKNNTSIPNGMHVGMHAYVPEDAAPFLLNSLARIVRDSPDATLW